MPKLRCEHCDGTGWEQLIPPDGSTATVKRYRDGCEQKVRRAAAQQDAEETARYIRIAARGR